MNNEKGKAIIMEQKINTRKTDEGYYVEVLHDGEVVWTDTFKTEEELNVFIKGCDGMTLTQEEARKLLENGNGPDCVYVFYRHPMGDRITFIYELDHAFELCFVNKDNCAEYRTVPTIDEAFQLIKDAENGKR